MNLIVLGRAGTGKGTLSLALAATYGLNRFDTGASLRAYAAAHDPALAAHLAAGGMAPELAITLLEDAIQSQARGLVIDGFPRTRSQADAVIPRWRDGRLPIDAVFLLEAPTPVLMSRLMGRSTCERCGAIYHDTTHPPPSVDQCTLLCGGHLLRRADDSAEGIARRHALYEQETLPAIADLRAAGVPLVQIDASGPADQVLVHARHTIHALRAIRPASSSGWALPTPPSRAPRGARATAPIDE